MLRRDRVLASLLVSLALGLHASPALADAAGMAAPQTPCEARLPPKLTLPSNAPALLLVDRGELTVEASLTSGATKTPLTATRDTNGLLTLPLPASTAGSYSVEGAASCTQGSYRDAFEAALTLTAPVALPSSVGSLVHVPKETPNGLDVVRLVPTPEMAAYFPASKVTLTVDRATTTLPLGANGPNQSLELTVHTGDVCIQDGVLYRDARVAKVSVEAFVAGVSERPLAATLEVQVDCGAIRWTEGGGAANPTAGPALSETEAQGSSSASGCSAAPRKTSGGAPVAALALALGLVAHARRRRRA